MNWNQYFQTKTLPSLGLLAFRAVMGAAFVLHGLPKVQNAFTWMGEGPIPGIMQAAAAYSEFLGGIALILGLFTPLAALMIIGTMMGALFLAHFPKGDPFVGNGSSYELALVYLTAAFMFLVNSPGKLSVDYWLVKALRLSGKESAGIELQA